jgi:hypothetical protein
MSKSASRFKFGKGLAPLIENRHDAILIICGIVISLIISGGFLIYQMKHRGCCDAQSYLEIAQKYASGGIFAEHPHAKLRSYLYPLALSCLLNLANAVNVKLDIVVWLFQWLVYVAAALALSLTISKKNKKIAIIAFMLFCINVFISPYLSITLTDALYTSLAIFWFAAAISYEAVPSESELVLKRWPLLLAALLSGAILAIRPAGIWVAAVTASLFISRCCRMFQAHKTIKSALRILGIFVVGLMLFLAPLIPQMLINHFHFAKITPFPVLNLGGTQFRWGIRYLKYGTNLSGPGDVEMFYINPFLKSEASSLWYLRHPLSGSATIAAKFIGAFDFDYLLPYIYDIRPFYRWPSAFISLSILFFGLWGLLHYAFNRDACVQRIFGERFLPAFCLLAWGAVTLLSALELRFTLPILALLMVFCIERLIFIAALRGKKLAMAAGAYLLAISFLLIVADFISRTNSVLYR